MKSSKYKYVYRYKIQGKLRGYRATLIRNGKKYEVTFTNETDAALFIDKTLISIGEAPINILKPLKR